MVAFPVTENYYEKIAKIFEILPIALRSYHPLKSIHCRISSIGGCAPYVSRAGMFRSSMKKMKYFPSGGPNTPFRLINRKNVIQRFKKYV